MCDRLERAVAPGQPAEWLAALQARAWSPSDLRRAVEPLTVYRRGARGYLHLRRELLDALWDKLLQMGQAPEATLALHRDMVHLEHTRASVLLELVDTVPLGPDDLFVDLGSGLGQVAIWVHLLTGAPTLGIERDGAFVAFARGQAQRVRADGARFVCADVREADLAAGSAFYLFTPFTGLILDAVLANLRAVAADKPITVCSYGPCTPLIARQPWLAPIDGHCDHDFQLAVWRSRP
jgi:SAM-dependent methyltransferase